MINTLVSLVGTIFEVCGVLIIAVGAVSSLAYALITTHHHNEVEPAFRHLKQNLARSILLGLEFFIAGDIIKFITVTPSFTTVGILTIIVLIRAFLSVELTMEIEGTFPWRRRKRAT